MKNITLLLLLAMVFTSCADKSVAIFNNDPKYCPALYAYGETWDKYTEGKYKHEERALITWYPNGTREDLNRELRMHATNYSCGRWKSYWDLTDKDILVSNNNVIPDHFDKLEQMFIRRFKLDNPTLFR